MKRAVLFLLLAGCSALDPIETANDPAIYPPQHDSISFEIVQKPESTKARWSLLGASSPSIIGTGESCVVEALDARPANQAVSGTATFSGAKLSQSLVIVAGQSDDPSVGSSGWTTGDRITFTSQGFSAPTVPPLEFDAPSTSLKILTDDGALTIDPSQDFDAHWAPGTQNKEDAVVVSLLTAGNVELRCSFGRDAIHGTIPKDLLAKLGSGSGTLAFGTSRLQAVGNDEWSVYVTATNVVREQPFTLAN